MSSKKASVVKLNVGGTAYEVSRSLIEKHPDSMLARLVSKTWQDGESEEPIFIERDGVRFRFVLDYMRDGSVSLPGTQDIVTKSSMIAELQYYGIPVTKDLIKVETSFVDIFKCMDRLTEEFNEDYKKMTKQRNQLDVDMACAVVAHGIAARRVTSNSNRVVLSIVKNEHPRSHTAEMVDNCGATKLEFEVMDALKKQRLCYHEADLNRALSKYGLAFSAYREHTFHISEPNCKSSYKIGKISATVHDLPFCQA